MHNKVKMIIGLPVFNGEKHLEKALNSLLNQTFHDFEIIISDNASTDKTEIISKEFVQKDIRVKYIKHKKNLGALKNFLFTLNKAQNQYFMWAAADDYWDPRFIENNLKVLETNENIIASISNVEFIGNNLPEMYKSNNKGTTYQYLIEHLPSTTTLAEKVSFHLRYNRGMSIYSIFRTEILKKCIIERNFCDWDQLVVLNTLKYGDLHIMNEVLMYRSAEGTTSNHSQIDRWKNLGIPFIEILFLEIPFTLFFIKCFGLIIFLKNFKLILKMNYIMERSVFGDLLRKIKKIF
jgi:glycosyltransferase involved in cell wall biosynthesis